MSSTTGNQTNQVRPTADPPRRLPNIAPAIGPQPHNKWWETGIPGCYKAFIAETVQGGNCLSNSNPCARIINAVATRLGTELCGHGIEGPELDRVVVDFLNYAFVTKNSSLEFAWQEYKNRDFKRRYQIGG
ncbi:uncharacterized protein BDV14DRAFT_162579 [Aspergillus stella-maris]|uniref:uncharacterized protein n=1 Tax=Aspergillus stella-maris TaxID=1810926 RepID=UPI003CCE50CE